VHVVLAIALLGAAPDAAFEDGPWVEIRESKGAVRGASPAIAAGRVHLELTVHNRLPVRVTELVFAIRLVTAANAAPIPGWRLEHAFEDTVLEPEETSVLRIDRLLPARRSVPDADDIRYEVELESYRIAPPRLEVVSALFQSPADADQRAGLYAYEHLATLGLPAEVIRAVKTEVRDALSTVSADPDGALALRLAIAVRAAGDLDDGSLVAPLLALPAVIDQPRWASAWSELGDRLAEASEPGDPRLELLPAAGSTIALGIGSRAVQDAIVRLGGRAVPELVRARAIGSSEPARTFATRLLHALGRGSVRAQLAIPDAEVRGRLIEVFGEIGQPEPVTALVELLARRRGVSRTAPMSALVKIGPAAIGPLIDALATTDAEARASVEEAIRGIGAPARPLLLEAARRYGVRVPERADVPTLAHALSTELAAGARARWATELQQGLDRARTGDWDAGIRSLDRVYAAAPELYMASAEPIARAYLARATTLYARGNYDAALEAARTGLTVKKTPELTALARDARLVLSRGYIELDQLERAEEILAPLEAGDDDARGVRARLWVRRAERALDEGDLGRARQSIGRAAALAPVDGEITSLDRRIYVFENLAIVIVLGLLVPGGALGIVVWLWRRAEAARMRRVEAGLDRS